MSTPNSNDDTTMSDDRFDTSCDMIGKLNKMKAGTITTAELDELINEMEEVVLPLAGHEGRRRS